MTACVLVLGMNAGTLQASVYDATGTAGQPVVTDETSFEPFLLYPGDSIANTEVILDGEPAVSGVLDDGVTPGWTNQSGRVYEVSVYMEAAQDAEAAQPVMLTDEFGEPVLDPETGEPIYQMPEGAEGPAEEHAWYDLQTWGGTVEVAKGTIDTPSQGRYSLPEAEYSYTDASGNPGQISSWEITAAAYPLNTQVSLKAEETEDGTQFQRWSVYTVEGNTLQLVSDDRLLSDPSLIPGLTPDQLNQDPLSFTVNGSGSRILFMPVYVQAQSEAVTD